MKKNKLLLICLLLISVALAMHSCKDDEQAEPEWDPSGLYNVTVQVTSRPPAILENNHQGIDYDHIIMYDEVFDTNQSLPCYYEPVREPYPSKYKLYGLRIFKMEGVHYILNRLDTGNFEQGITYHIPLSTHQDSAYTDFNVINEKNYITSLPVTYTTFYSWPFSCNLLDLKIAKNNTGTITGSWKLVHKVDVCNTEVSTGETKAFFMSEFATLTFERIGD